MISAMEKILIAACLLGEKCTYKGGDNRQGYIEELNRYFDLIPFCPEVEGGLPTPRLPAEKRGSSVMREDNVDVTKEFHLGAYKATAIASYLGIRIAIMKENSPSCGVHHVHDGYFRNRLVEGEGVTVAALRRMGVTVYNEEEGLKMLEELKRQEAIKDAKTAENLAKADEPKKEEKPRYDRGEGKPRFDKGKGKPRFNKDDSRPHKYHEGKEGEKEGERPHLKRKPGFSFQGKTRPFTGKGKPTKRFGSKPPRKDKKD